ncbi:tmv resistance protein n [Nicotiana attenuata]|uniref:Tmv resistance protein n n=1 Tax=Nicotiana attenuata TaxID=49451 RepID=A0A314L283_NICAT|nr:tmv resistance protein n [Nicotiana attenuata]
MENCKNLKCLPNSIQMKSLESLNLSGCEKLENFPEIRGNMEFLSELMLSRTAIQELPSSVGQLIGISLLDLSSCRNLVTLPASIYEMRKLKILNLKGCSKLATFPENLGDLGQLEEVNASNTAIWQLPDSFGNLSKLRILSLKRGWKLKHQSAGSLIFPKSFGCLKELKILDLSGCNLSGEEINAFSCLTALLELNLSRNEFIFLPDSISQLSQLQYLNLTYCLALIELPKLPPSIEELYVEDFLAPQAILALPMYPRLYLVSFTNYSFVQQPYTEKSNDNSALEKILCLVLSDAMDNVVHPSLNSDHRVSYCIVFPERAIPTWFKYQSNEEKISFKLPKFWCSPEFMGFAICCVTCMGAGIHGCDLRLSGKYDYTFIEAKLICNNHPEELEVLEKVCKVGSSSRSYSLCVCLAYIPLYSLLEGLGTKIKNFNQYGVFEASIQRRIPRQWGVHLIYKSGRQFFRSRLHDGLLGHQLR